MKKIDLVISKNHFVFACSRRVLLHLHRVSTFSSLEEKTNSVEETTNSVERTEVKNLIPITDTSSGLNMPKIQMIRGEMPPDQNT